MTYIPDQEPDPKLGSGSVEDRYRKVEGDPPIKDELVRLDGKLMPMSEAYFRIKMIYSFPW